MNIKMDFKALKWQILHGSLAKRLLLRAFVFALAMTIVSFVQIGHSIRTIEPLLLNFSECPLNVGLNSALDFTGFLKPVSAFAFPLLGAFRSVPCGDSENLTLSVFKELMEKDLLDNNAKALCVDEGSISCSLALRELGVCTVYGVVEHPFFSLFKKRFAYELKFDDNCFDFVFSRALDRVSVPALLVLEIERVLRPGGIGAMLVGAPNLYSGSLIRSAMPVSSLLRSSTIVHVCAVGPFTLVIFKKRFDSVASFEHYRLPNECPSITNNKPVMKYIEPLADGKSGQSAGNIGYLPKLRNISSINRLVFVNVGAGEFLNSSIAKMFKTNYPIRPQGLNIYVVDHNTSALSSYVKKPGISFVYHPGLAGDVTDPEHISDDFLSAPLDEGGFDFIHWFKETVRDVDFVVLMMKARQAELKILFELYETGAICHVDEIFLHCSDGVDCNTAATCGDCMSLFRGLRNSGVFVHQWWGD